MQNKMFKKLIDKIDDSIKNEKLAIVTFIYGESYISTETSITDYIFDDYSHLLIYDKNGMEINIDFIKNKIEETEEVNSFYISNKYNRDSCFMFQFF